MTKQEMMNEVIRMYGFEDKRTILFCEIAEETSEKELFSIFIAVLALETALLD